MESPKTKKITFIVNPISGIGKQRKIEQLIREYLDHAQFESSIVYTKYAGHAVELSKELSKHQDILVAVGGDGSVNEVARGIVHTSTHLGIIPTGSGNGLARTLAIPLQPKKAIQSLNKTKSAQIDVVQFEKHISLCASGCGFDAVISAKFAKAKKRGFWSYVKLGLSSYFSYKPTTFKVDCDGKQFIFENNLILSIANANQYGNDIFISPAASLYDGYMRLVSIEKSPWYELPYLFYCLRTNKLNKFKRYTEIKASEITIFNPNQEGHVDGEPVKTSENVNVKVLPHALNMIKP